jgi:hypothetical protein
MNGTRLLTFHRDIMERAEAVEDRTFLKEHDQREANSVGSFTVQADVTT